MSHGVWSSKVGSGENGPKLTGQRGAFNVLSEHGRLGDTGMHQERPSCLYSFQLLT